MTDIHLDIVAMPTPDLVALIGELNDELGALYTPEQRHGLALDAHSLAAIRFHDRQGFRTCEPFAPYTAMPPAAIITSVFLEKRLLPPGAPAP